MSESIPHPPVETRRVGSRVRPHVRLFVVCGALTAVVLGAWATNVFRSVEEDSVDARFSIRGTHAPPVPIAVVGIDDATLRELGPYPFRRGWHANTIDAVRDDGARAIVYDVEFAEESASAEDDNALVLAVERTRHRIVLEASEVNAQGDTAVLGGTAVLTKIGARVGNGSISPDDDGTLRRVSYATNGLESFGLVGAEIASGRKIDESGWIDYLGPSGTVPHYSLVAVAQHRFEPGTFRGKVVVVGATAASLQDVARTSTDTQMSGPEIQANVVATALAGFPLQSVPGWVDVLLIVACGMLVPVLRLRLSLGLSLLAAVGAGFVLAGGTQLAFQAGWVTSSVYPLMALVLSTIGALAVAASNATQGRF
jgi:adenylate cyclase